MDKYGKALCMDHQRGNERPSRKAATPEAKKLAKALAERGWRVELEKFDGYKHIDIAITEARVNIEVDGPHHSSSPKQALADLQRTYYSFVKGYLTLRIPNVLVKDEKILAHTANYLTQFMNAKDDDWDSDDDDFDYDDYDEWDDDDDY